MTIQIRDEPIYSDEEGAKEEPLGPGERYVWQDGIERTERAVDYYLNEIHEKYEKSRVVVVQAEGGAGKTSRIGPSIIDKFPDEVVYQTQNRRLAVEMSSEHMAEEMKERVGNTIGYRLVNAEQMYSENTRLLSLIDQTLVNTIIRTNKLPEGTIIVDEAHDRTTSTDVLLYLIKKYLPDSPDTRVIVTSATIDTKKFADYFGSVCDRETTDEGTSESAPIVDIKVPTNYPIETNVIRLEKKEHHTDKAIKRTVQRLEQFATGELTIPSKDPTSTEREVVEEGNIFVMLPGKEELYAAREELERTKKRLGLTDDQVEIVLSHSEVDDNMKSKVKSKVPEGKLRFTIGTDIIRSSITGDKVVGVVDSMQVRRNEVSSQGVSHLKKVTVSGAEMHQAMIRTGRQTSGFYDVISHGFDYERRVDRNSEYYYPTPEILREATSNATLQLTAISVDMREADLIDKPEVSKIEGSMYRLRAIGALDNDNKITEKGRELLRFPTNPERANTLIEADKHGLLPEAMIAVSVIERGGITAVPRKTDTGGIVLETSLIDVLNEQLDHNRGLPADFRKQISEYLNEGGAPEVYLSKWLKNNGDGTYTIEGLSARGLAKARWKEFAQGSESDFTAAVNAYREYKETKSKFYAQGKEKRKIQEDLRIWCQENYLNYKKMRLVEESMQLLQKEVEMSPLQMDANPRYKRAFDSDMLTAVVATGSPDMIFKYLGKNNFAGRATDETSGAGVQTRLSSNSAHIKENSKFIVAGGVNRDYKQEARENNYYMSIVAGLDIELLMQHFPEYCKKTELDGTAYIDNESGKVYVRTQTKFFENIIKEENTEASEETIALYFAKQLTLGEIRIENIETTLALQNRVIELLSRQGNRDGSRLFQEWYANKIIGCKNLDEIYNLNLTLTEKDISEIIGKDYKEFEQEVLTETPDFITIGGKKVEINYYLDNHTAQVRLLLSIDELENLSPKDIPPFKGFTIYIRPKEAEYMSYAGYIRSPEDITRIKKSVEEKRKRVVWDNFANGQVENGRAVRQYAGASLYEALTEEKIIIKQDAYDIVPDIREGEVWDSKTGEKIYYAPIIINSDNGRVEYAYIVCKTLADAQRQYEYTARSINFSRVGGTELRDDRDETQRQLEQKLQEIEEVWQVLRGANYTYGAFGISPEEFFGIGEDSLAKKIEELPNPRTLNRLGLGTQMARMREINTLHSRLKGSAIAFEKMVATGRNPEQDTLDKEKIYVTERMSFERKAAPVAIFRRNGNTSILLIKEREDNSYEVRETNITSSLPVSSPYEFAQESDDERKFENIQEALEAVKQEQDRYEDGFEQLMTTENQVNTFLNDKRENAFDNVEDLRSKRLLNTMTKPNEERLETIINSKDPLEWNYAFAATMMNDAEDILELMEKPYSGRIDDTRLQQVLRTLDKDRKEAMDKRMYQLNTEFYKAMRRVDVFVEARKVLRTDTVKDFLGDDKDAKARFMGLVMSDIDNLVISKAEFTNKSRNSEEKRTPEELTEKLEDYAMSVIERMV